MPRRWRWARRDLEVRDHLTRDDFRGPRARGFISSWLVLAPAALDPGESGAQALDRRRLPDEPVLRPCAGDRVAIGGRELAWREHRSSGSVVDFNAGLGRTGERSLAYALCYLESDRARDDLWLQVGSDDQAQVRLDGREVYHCPVPRPLESLDTIGPVSLKRGTNVLLIKVANETATWEAAARLVDGAGRPAEGIVVKLSP